MPCRNHLRNQRLMQPNGADMQEAIEAGVREAMSREGRQHAIEA